MTSQQVQEMGYKIPPAGQGRVCERVKPSEAAAKSEVTRPSIRLPKEAEPNKTEAEYGRILQVQFPGKTILYEAVTFRLKCGARYTPDWTVWIGPTILLAVECKGAFRLGSADRSNLAFKSAIAEFPNIRWRHAQKSKDGWKITEK